MNDFPTKIKLFLFSLEIFGVKVIEIETLKMSTPEVGMTGH